MLALIWNSWDTLIVLTAALAAMACAVPGVWLVLRQQSMMGDALSHTALPGVVISVLGLHALRDAGLFNSQTADGLEPFVLSLGAVVIGVATSLLTEAVQKLGRVEASAALGVVFTTMFALGLFLMRLKADAVHIDPDCVLFGQLELIVLDRVPVFGLEVPRAILSNLALLIINLGLLKICWKELSLATFDPELSTALGVNARLIHYGLMAVTAMTVVSAYSSVGFILVIGLLIVPAATASLLTDQLGRVIGISLLVAAGSAAGGHLLSKILPQLIFSRLGFADVDDAGTSGMMAASAGGMFLLALLCAPRYGIVGKIVARIKLGIQIVADDILGELFRREELGLASAAEVNVGATSLWDALRHRVAVWNLGWRGYVDQAGPTLSLTPPGRARAQELVRAHRLWESYMQKHFDVPDDHLHLTAHMVEHYIDDHLHRQLDEELESPSTDPHGKAIPPSGT